METWLDVANETDGELSRIIERYKWYAAKDKTNFGEKILIDIVQLGEGRYMGVPNKQVKTPKQVSPYAPLHIQDSPISALRDVIRGLQMFMTTPQETTWPLLEDEEIRKLVREELKKISKTPPH